MGGLAVDVSDIDDRLHVVTITPAGLIFLVERGHSIEVSDDNIRDKSKADIFAKCLVILQVTWIALQTISRKAAGCPLSPLEIHTLVHAACASVMYILWFQKPLDVQAPVIVSKAGFEDLVALMLMQSPRMGTTWYSHLDPPNDFEPIDASPKAEASFLLFDHSALHQRDEGCSSCGGLSTPSTTTNVEVADKGVPLHVIPTTCDNRFNLPNSKRQEARLFNTGTLSSQITLHPPTGILCEPPPGVSVVCEIRSGEFTPEGIALQPLMTKGSRHDEYYCLPWFLCCFDFLDPRPPEPVLPAQISPVLKERLPERLSREERKTAYWHEINLYLSEKDQKRWKLAGAAFSKEMEIQGLSEPSWSRYREFSMAQLPIFPSSTAETSKGWPRVKPLLAQRCPNVNWNLRSKTNITRLTWTLCFICSLYGGIHLVLWNYDFPTRAESFLWRISATTLGSAPALLIPYLIIIVMDEYDTYSSTWRERRAPKSLRDDPFQPEAPRSSSPCWLQKILPAFCSGIRYIWESCYRGIFRVVVDSVILSAIVAAALLYIFARIFIVVESFISLRHVPIGVYEGGLGWSKYIPHL